MVYKWYILPIGGFYGTYHLLREPGNSIDLMASRKVTREPLNDKSMKELEDAGRSASMAITRWINDSAVGKFGCVEKKSGVIFLGK